MRNTTRTVAGTGAALLLAGLLPTLAAPTYAADGTEQIADPALHQCISETLKRADHAAPITTAELETLSGLNCKDRKPQIASLKGLEQATN